MSILRWALLLLLIAMACALVDPVSQWRSQRRYNHKSGQIQEKINTLRSQKPDSISEEMWNECLDWAGIAHVNICFSERHAPYEALCRFEKQLDEKLKQQIDLSTIEWIGKRLEETGPHGHRYMNTSTQWWKEWEYILDRYQHSKTNPESHK